MVLILLISVMGAALAYIMARRLPVGYRAIFAGLVFAALNAPNIMVLVVGDQAADGAGVVTKEEPETTDNSH